MSAETAIAAIGPRSDAAELLGAVAEPAIAHIAPQTTNQTSFGDLIARGLAGVEAKIEHANNMAAAFAIDDTIPIHEVTIALEEARLAVELALQVRNRLVDGYREIMNMQL